jgi:hypothetical protein
MNDPHVAVLIYSVETGEEISINNAPPVEEETSELRMRLADDVATFYMKTHYPSEKSARELVDSYLHAWELDVALKYGHKRKLCFSFVRSTIIDRDPPPPPPPGSRQIVELEGVASAATTTHLKVIPQLRHYPEPPKDFSASSDAKVMWELYERYLENQERLMTMAFSCLSRLQFSAARSMSGNGRWRKKAAKMYRVDEKVLRKLGHLSTNVGDEVGARKLDWQSELRPPTAEEVAWIEEAIKKLIRRAGEYAADPQKQWPQITMADLPVL